MTAVTVNDEVRAEVNEEVNEEVTDEVKAEVIAQQMKIESVGATLLEVAQVGEEDMEGESNHEEASRMAGEAAKGDNGHASASKGRRVPCKTAEVEAKE